MASGGIAPAQAQEWLDAGALAVGIGAQARSRPTPSATLCSDPLLAAACGSRRRADDSAVGETSAGG